MNILELGQVGPFMGVQMDEIITFGKRKFRIILYGAYNALGLIGPENNGIAVLDEDNKTVVLDKEACENSGYYGASKKQKERFVEITKMIWPTFRRWVDEHQHNRGSYDCCGSGRL